MTTASIRKNHRFIVIRKLVIVSLIVGFLAGFLGLALKRLTEHYETILFAKTIHSPLYIFLFPFVGLSIIFIFRHYLFKTKRTKALKKFLKVPNRKRKIFRFTKSRRILSTDC